MLDLFKKMSTPNSLQRMRTVTIENLEGRRLLSGDWGGFGGGFRDFGGREGATIEFTQAPSAVQTALKTLASTDNLTMPTPTQTVELGNRQGVETYTVDITGTGTDTRLTVDQTGAPVTAPTETTTTFGAVTNAAVTAEFNAIATGLGLTAATPTTTVDVSTTAAGASVYTISLASSSTTTSNNWWDGGDTRISVDASGNPVGNEQVPLGTLSAVIQSGLKSNPPAGATALTGTSLIQVSSPEGAPLYTATYTGTGATSSVTVDATGKPASQPSSSSTTFGAITNTAVTGELQTLATADGVSGTISSTQSVTVLAEGNGTTIYTVTLTATNSSTGTSETYPLSISVDQAGNPTVPSNGFGRGGRGDRGFGGCDGSGGFSSTGTTTTTTTTTTGTTSTGTSSSGGIKTLSASIAKATATAAKTVKHAVAHKVHAKPAVVHAVKHHKKITA